MSKKHQDNRLLITNRGAALLLLTLLFSAGSMLVALSIGKTVYTDTVAYTRLQDTKQNILAADSGLEDVVYRLRANKDVSNMETLALFGATTTTATTEVSGNTEVSTTATTTNRTRKREMILSPGGIGVAFNYGVQVGEGGIEMSNSASVDGNVYSNGPLVGTNSMVIYGDAVSAGAGGHIDDVDVRGSAYAHTIEDSEIGTDAHYQIIGDTSVAGTSYPASPDQPLGTLPITDETIEELKADAEAGGGVACSSYTISSQTVTLGPVKIDCNLTISGSSVVTLAGHVWVSGSITVSNTSQIKLSSSLGALSAAMIADNEADRLSSSGITIGNSSQFIGNPDGGAYVVLISQNNSAESGGSTKAITISNNNPAGDVVLYASHGEIEISNSAQMVEVTAYKIRAQNSAQVIYKEGLASLLFSGGPSGGYRIESWNDI